MATIVLSAVGASIGAGFGGTIMGLGTDGYRLAVEALKELLK